MIRCPLLADLTFDLLEIAIAMLDGSYWEDEPDGVRADLPSVIDPPYWD